MNLNSHFEDSRLISLVNEDKYEEIRIIWGTDALFSILKWYQFIGNEKSACKIIKCIEDHLDRQFEDLSSGRSFDQAW